MWHKCITDHEILALPCFCQSLTHVACSFRDIFCAGRVPEEDLRRTMKACGGSIQTSVNNLTSDVLGKCEIFQEEQIGGERCVCVCICVCLCASLLPHTSTHTHTHAHTYAHAHDTHAHTHMHIIHTYAYTYPHTHTHTHTHRYNIFTGCPEAKTCTIILRGGAEQFIEETERSLHDAIMIVRRTIKNDAVVAGEPSCLLGHP